MPSFACTCDDLTNCRVLIMTWLLAAAPVVATETGEPTDYAVCRACDLASATDPEVKSYIETIAGYRWSADRTAAGRVVIEGPGERVATWRYTIDENGSVGETELLSITPEGPETAED